MSARNLRPVGTLMVALAGSALRLDPSAVAAPTTGDSPAKQTLAIAPFAAHYTADWKSINVGTSDLLLRPDALPGHFVYTWTVTARGVFRLMYSHDVVQRSWFSLEGGHIRPDRYRAEQGDEAVQLDFDWADGRVRGMSQTKPVDLPLAPGTQDIMSIQIEVMHDLKTGKLPSTFDILDKDQIKDFNYTLEGPARIRTSLGVLDTVIVASQRPGNSRLLRMWFAPALGYVPVQAERSRDGRVEFSMRIKSLAK